MPKYIKPRIKWFGSDVFKAFVMGFACGIIVTVLVMVA